MFIASGPLPEHGDYSQMNSDEGYGKWYSVDELLHVRKRWLEVAMLSSTFVINAN